jgi:hypothetical protein
MMAKRHCAILLVVLAAGCYRWGPMPGAGLAHPEKEELDRVTVWLRDSTEFELDDAAITSDSLVGLQRGTPARLAIARSDIARVETQNPDPFLTFVTGALAAVVALLFLAMTAPRT